MDKATQAFEAFQKLLKKCFFYDSNYVGYIARNIGKSQQTVKQYKSAPGSKSHRTPTAEVIEGVRELVIHRDVQMRNVVCGGEQHGFKVKGVTDAFAFQDYLVALDFADSRRGLVVCDGEMPALTDDARLRHQWRRVAFGGIVPVDVLAEIAGTDVYTVGWVGREHPTEGIQPTADMVARAMAAEALTNMRSAA